MKTIDPTSASGEEKPRKTVLIIDDHIVVRQGLHHLIDREEDLVVCGEAGDAVEGLDSIRRLNPDIVIADIPLPGMNGVEFIKNARACRPDLPIVVFSMHEESLYAERTLRAGARGYVMKKADCGEIITALRKVLEGGIHTSGEMEEKLLRRTLGNRQPKSGSPVSRLSDRELEVFEMIGHGRTSHEIAEALSLSVKTVDTHRQHIREKLGLRTTTELVQHAVHHVENGLEI